MEDPAFKFKLEINPVSYWRLPSGKHTKNYGKIMKNQQF